jgi:ABC-type antimicrobial peptide transport system permease subunit
LLMGVGSGVVIGTVLALALNRMAASWSASYESSPAMLLPGIFILAVVSGIACALPAWRASNIDPMMALRSE